MKLYQWLILITTSILLVITMGDLLNLSVGFLFILVFAGHSMLIMMVIAILKAPRKSQKRFDDYFYEDWDYRRS